MENPNKKEENKELDRIFELIEKMLEKFDKHIPLKENNVLIFLKAHLLVEYYLNQIIIIYGDKDSYKKCEDDFFVKIDYIDQLKLISTEKCEAIRRLNKIRNKLSHELEYEISESDMDSMGFCMGKSYIIYKFKKETDLKALLIFVLRQIITFVYMPIATKIMEEEKSKEGTNAKTTTIKPVMPIIKQ